MRIARLSPPDPMPDTGVQTGLRSGLYTGLVNHARFLPRPHSMRYKVFMLLLDLDEVEALDRRLTLFGAERPALLGFSAKDHLDGADTPLKAQVEAMLHAANLPTGGAIQLLAMPRLFGRVFNPLSVFFCHGPDGQLSAILYEVRNTFGERHCYLIPASEVRGPVHQSIDKAFYVSPFMDMDLNYAFRIIPPGDAVSVAIDVSGPAGRILKAAFSGRRSEITDASLFRAWLRHPMMTLGVLLPIHWEALKIWLKGEKLRHRPPAPVRQVTVGTGL